MATGVGVNQLSGNSFDTIGYFHHERILLKIPLLAVLEYNISDNFRVAPSFGFYAQTILKDQYEYLNNSQKNNYNGWNYGAQLEFGLAYRVSNRFSVGFNYGLQFDLSKFKINPDLETDNKQKLGKLNALGIILIIELG